MTWGATAVAGATLVSGMMSADAAGDAASQQAAGQRYSADLQKQMFDIQNAQQAPYRESGGAALKKMNYLLGLDTGAKTYEQYRQELLPKYTTGTPSQTGLRGGINTGILSDLEGQGVSIADLASLPDNLQRARLGGNTVKEIQSYASSQKGSGSLSGKIRIGAINGSNNSVGQTINESALDAAIRARMAADAAAPKGEGFGKYSEEYSLDDFQQDPGYAFRLKMGQDQAMRQANLAGGAVGGNALASLQDYTQGSASQEFGNAFNRYQTDKTNIFNRLASIAGLGQTSVGQTTTASGLAGANIGNAYGNAASAQAAGTVGAANAYGGAIQSMGNQYYLSNLLKPQTQTPTGYGTPVSQPVDMNLA